MNQEIAIIPKNAISDIRISISEYQGHDLVDLRTYIEKHDSSERVATKKGISLHLSQLPELIAALQEAAAVAKESGLLKAEQTAEV